MITIETYTDQCSVNELWQFVEENLKLSDFPEHMDWVTETEIKEYRKKKQIFLAMQDDNMLGCIIIKKGNIEILGIRKDCRREGIGKALVKHVIVVLKQDKRRKYVTVDSLVEFNAKEFYEKIGFVDYMSNEIDYTWHLKREL